MKKGIIMSDKNRGLIMSKSKEVITKRLVSDKLKTLPGYPNNYDTELNGITWFKEDSYCGSSTYGWLEKAFEKASKKQTLKEKGTPDFVVTLNNSETIIVIECKKELDKHSSFVDINKFITRGFGKPADTINYAVNGSLWYASFLKDRYDVVAIGVSGQNNAASRVTSFVWPKGKDFTELKLLENGNLDDSLVSIIEYENDINIALGRFQKTEDEIRKELRRYTLKCANFLRDNGIEDNTKAGFISAVILGLTNHKSDLFKLTKDAIDKKNLSKSKKMISDALGKSSLTLLKDSLYGKHDKFSPDHIDGIWDIDGIPEGKRVSLKNFYDSLLSRKELLNVPKGKNKYFCDGDTVLSCCIYSLYENVIIVLDKYSGIDVMGEFYTTFLRFTKGNAKEKGIVLTPKHITELFCDIAEYYLGKNFDENTKIIDICCGTGAFLISSLNRIKDNISKESISEEKKAEKIKYAQKNCLIGVEKEASMYALAYANMRFHGDGKSNLFNCSSLMIDSYAPVDESGMTFLNDEKQVPLHEALSKFKKIDVGMINPPFSLDKKDNSSLQEYEIIKRLNSSRAKVKDIEKNINSIKTNKTEGDLKSLNKQLSKAKKELLKTEKEYDASGMQEVAIQKGQDELDFIASMLHYLREGGIGVAIVPMSCAGNSGKELRSKLLEHHTLLACMTMPQNLFFDSRVGTSTCIMVFRAHIKHDVNRPVFLARWQDDGFTVIPHNGRKDAGTWNSIKKEWIEQLQGTAKPNKYVWLRKNINIFDEALAEAYIETDYSELSQTDFEITLKKRALFEYMEKNGLLDE